MSRFFPAALVLEGATALVVGGEAEAAGRAAALRAAGARVELVAEQATPEVMASAARGELRWWARRFVPADLHGARLVVMTSRDAALLSEVRAATRRAGVWLCAIDRPAACDFVNVATADVGPLSISVSTHGAAPALAARLRDLLARGLDERFSAFAEAVAARRAALADVSETERRARMGESLTGLELEIVTRYPTWFEERA